jgi:hypothetical protein
MKSIGLPRQPVGLSLMFALIGLCGLCTVNASSASARVAGLERIKVTSPANSDPEDDGNYADATCPGGKVLLGGGGEAEGDGEVVIDDMAPLPSTNTFRVKAYEDNDGGADYTPDWTVTAYAFCAEPLSGLERTEHSSLVNSTEFKQVSVACSSPTKILLGASGTINSAWGEAVMEVMEPFGFASSEVWAREEDPFAPNWSVTTYATCADPGGLGQGARVERSSSSLHDWDQTKSAVAECPPGQAVVGVGGHAFTTGEAVIDKIVPGANLETLKVTAHVTDSYSDPWSLTAVATCFTR